MSGLLAWLCAGKRAFLSVRSFDDPYPRACYGMGWLPAVTKGCRACLKGFAVWRMLRTSHTPVRFDLSSPLLLALSDGRSITPCHEQESTVFVRKSASILS